MLTLLDVLRTPMAAPETPGIKRMRMTILVLCSALVGSIAAIDPLRAVIGIGAGAVVGGLLIVLVVLVPVYFVTKTRADDAHLAALLAETDQ